MAVVIAGSTHRIGVAADLENVMCGVRNYSGQLVQSFFGLLGQVGFIKTKVHGGFSNRMIVIQVGHSIGKRIHARDGLSSSLLGLVGQSACRHGLLVGSFGRGVYAGNALLCPAIYITDVAGVTVRDFIELIGLIDQRSSLFGDIILRGAAGRKYHGEGGKCGDDVAIHAGLLNLPGDASFRPQHLKRNMHEKGHFES